LDKKKAHLLKRMDTIKIRKVEAAARRERSGSSSSLEPLLSPVKRGPSSHEKANNGGPKKMAQNKSLPNLLHQAPFPPRPGKNHTNPVDNLAHKACTCWTNGSFREAIKLVLPSPHLPSTPHPSYLCFFPMKCEQAMYLDRKHFDAHFIRAVAHQSMGKCKRAIVDYNKCVTIRPNSCAQVLYNRGLCETQLGNDENALRDFSHAINLDPHMPQLYFNRALVRISHSRNVSPKLPL
jgi:tetratricopeptide (TPR) repeat protein